MHDYLYLLTPFVWLAALSILGLSILSNAAFLRAFDSEMSTAIYYISRLVSSTPFSRQIAHVSTLYPIPSRSLKLIPLSLTQNTPCLTTGKANRLRITHETFQSDPKGENFNIISKPLEFTSSSFPNIKQQNTTLADNQGSLHRFSTNICCLTSTRSDSPTWQTGTPLAKPVHISPTHRPEANIAPARELKPGGCVLGSSSASYSSSESILRNPDKQDLVLVNAFMALPRQRGGAHHPLGHNHINASTIHPQGHAQGHAQGHRQWWLKDDHEHLTLYVKGFLTSGNSPSDYSIWVHNHRWLVEKMNWSPVAHGYHWRTGQRAFHSFVPYTTILCGLIQNLPGFIPQTLPISLPSSPSLISVAIANDILIQIAWLAYQYSYAEKCASTGCAEELAQIMSNLKRHPMSSSESSSELTTSYNVNRRYYSHRQNQCQDEDADGQKFVRVVAHSLGCRLVAEASAMLPQEYRPDEVHLLGPAMVESDVALDTVSRHKTFLYYSQRDGVLASVFRVMSRGRKALGQVGPKQAYDESVITAHDCTDYLGFWVHNQYKRQFPFLYQRALDSDSAHGDLSSPNFHSTNASNVPDLLTLNPSTILNWAYSRWNKTMDSCKEFSQQVNDLVENRVNTVIEIVDSLNRKNNSSNST